MITNDLAERLKNHPDFILLQSHIREEMAKLDTLDGIVFDDMNGKVEGRARQIALDKLNEILEPFLFLQEEQSEAREIKKKKLGL
jgi:hypothetical protein